jgi:hypothetical protein
MRPNSLIVIVIMMCADFACVSKSVKEYWYRPIISEGFTELEPATNIQSRTIQMQVICCIRRKREQSISALSFDRMVLCQSATCPITRMKIYFDHLCLPQELKPGDWIDVDVSGADEIARMRPVQD